MLERFTRTQCLLFSAVGTIAIAGLVAAAAAGLIVAFGLYDVAADKPHWPVTSWIMHTTMADSVWLRSRDVVAPKQFSAAQVQAGFMEYDDHCIMCHGAPGISRSQWVMGLDPTPPYLIDISRQLSPGEIKFIISHGIKLTAMPAWDLTLSQEKIADLGAFLERLPTITPAQYRRMRVERNRGPDLAGPAAQ
jgi:mono/diheme cytochrome c family protein